MEVFNPIDAEFGGHRVRYTTETPRRVSVFDAIKAITGNANPRQKFAELQTTFPEVVRISDNFSFPGRGQRETPVTDARGLVTIMNLLPGERAARFRAKEADVLVRYLGGDPTLIGEIQGIRRVQEGLPADHPARIFGEDVELSGRALDVRERELQTKERELQDRREEREEARRRDEVERPAKMMRLAEQGKSLLEGIGMFEISDIMTYKAVVVTAMGLQTLPAPDSAEAQTFYTLSELLLARHGKVVNWKLLAKPGADASRMYSNAAGAQPHKKTTECNGKLVPVNCYGDAPVKEGGMTGWEIAETALRHHGVL